MAGQARSGRRGSSSTAAPTSRESSALLADPLDSLGVWYGGTATAYIADVSGERVVIATLESGSSVNDRAELDAILTSIEIV